MKFEIGMPTENQVIVYCSSPEYARQIGVAVMELLFNRKSTLKEQGVNSPSIVEKSKEENP